MADTTLSGVLLKGVAASRPAANTVAKGTIYSATDTGAISQSDASSWSTFATISSGLADPMTTRGDIIVRNASNATARLGIGASGRVLTSDGTDIAWTAPAAGSSTASYVKAYANATQTLGAATLTAVAFNLEEADTDAYHDNSTNNTRFTVPSGKDGVFLALGYVFSGINGVFLARWRKNGSTAIRGQSIQTNSNTTGGMVVSTGPIHLVATDYLELQAYLASGGAIGDATNAEQQCFGSLTRLGS